MKFTKETFKRAERTFLQALIATLAVMLPQVDFTVEGETLKTTLFGLLASAIAAAISAVMNLETTGTDGTDNTDNTDETEGGED